MDENAIIDHLEELIKSFGVQIRREPIKQDEDWVKVVGGLCLLKGEYILIINSRATTMDRIKTLAKALKHFDLDQIYLRPVLRELLEGIPVKIDAPHDIVHAPLPKGVIDWEQSIKEFKNGKE